MAASQPAFMGRSAERHQLDGLLERIRQNEGAALVVRGEAGIGKTALMRYCARQASGCRITEVIAVESEMEMPFAALHELCSPILGELPALADPQRQALEVAFGLKAGNPPDRFLVGLAVLGLLAEASRERPLVWLVDDAQWLDEATCQIVAFVGRRLLAEAVLLLIAVRETADERLLPALPTLTLDGLADDDARALLVAAIPGHLDEQIRDRMAETHGNPLGLLELPRGMSPAELAGGFRLPDSRSLPHQIENHYLQPVRALPQPTRQLMLLAAADPTGDAALLWRAAETLGIAHDAVGPAQSEQLLEVTSRVRFRHPLVRSAAYVAANDEDRSVAHLALAEAVFVARWLTAQWSRRHRWRRPPAPGTLDFTYVRPVSAPDIRLCVGRRTAISSPAVGIRETGSGLLRRGTSAYPRSQARDGPRHSGGGVGVQDRSAGLWQSRQSSPEPCRLARASLGRQVNEVADLRTTATGSLS